MGAALLKQRKIGFIGAGNMSQAIIKALIDSGVVPVGNLFATNRSPGKLKKLEETLGVTSVNTNEELVDLCDIVILGVKPQDLVGVLEPIASSFHESQIVISLAAGFSLQSLKRLLPQVIGIARAMPNTPATIRKAVVGYCLAEGAEAYEGSVEELLKPLGIVVPLDEGEMFEALTVSCGSGPGFIFEMMLYWQEWLEEHGFEGQIAKEMVIQTFLGAAELASQAGDISIQELQDRVVSKKGVTAAGLQSMRELEIERALRYSFEKAVIRDQEITRGTAAQ
ncbi:MAG: pyrroline-5-carboxylate reductase [Proteobacteria bacterium]|nr:MAG: pyrroline-5-carboxylate reductase [Pseudomonadota bacterium]